MLKNTGLGVFISKHLLAQHYLDQYPGFVPPVPSSDLVLPSIHGKLVCLGGSVTPKTLVSSALTADREFVNIYDPGNLGSQEPAFIKA